MSNLVIEIINVSVEVKPTKVAGKTYELFDVAFKNKSFQDKVEGKKIAAFVSPKVTAILRAAKFGDTYTVVREKDGEYWKWVDMVIPGQEQEENTNMNTPVKTNPTPKSNYETSEERAARQVMIVRQSSISAAVNALKLDKAQLNATEVIAMARNFEAYVLGTDDAELDDVPM